MKNAITLFLVLLISTVSFAQIPSLISFQGILKDSDGQPVEDGTYEVKFRIHDAETDGEILWESMGEPLLIVTTNGFFKHILGSTNPITGEVFDVTVGLETYLGITVEQDPELSPRTRFVSVPYAYNADKLDGYDAADLMGGMEPSGTFIEYVFCPSECTQDIWSNVGVTREITSIRASSNGTATDIMIDGQTVMRFRTIANSTGYDTWYKHNGAGIIVGGTSTVSIHHTNDGTVTITGFEY